MMFPRIVVQQEACRILDEYGIWYREHGEKPMWAEVGERAVVEMTQEAYPGLIVAGMAAATVCGGPRMGPIFGGMLLSGEKAARIVIENLGI